MVITFSSLHIVQDCTVISPYIFVTSESQLEETRKCTELTYDSRPTTQTQNNPTYLRIENKPQVTANANMFKVLDNKVLHDFTFFSSSSSFTVVNQARAEKPDLSGFSFRNILYSSVLLP